MGLGATFKECVDKGIITKTVPDKERARQMLQMAQLRQKFWGKKISKEFSVLKIEAYYEIIKELVFASIYKQGYNCTSHLCMVAFVKEKISDFDFESQKIDELRKVRNEISYRGKQISLDYLERNELEFGHIIKRLEKEAETA